jgi:glycosyltransferase involved in cell wall biosynthesis
MHTEDNPLVSIVVIASGNTGLLRPAVAACLGQTHQNVEVIVVGNGSPEEHWRPVAAIDDSRLRIIHQETAAAKLPEAINRGLGLAKGAYMTWAPSDCIYRPEAIERMVSALAANPAAGQVYANFCEVEVSGANAGDEDGPSRLVELVEPEQFFQAESDPGGFCFLISRSLRELVGLHDVTAYPAHDYDYRLRIAQRAASLHIQEPLCDRWVEKGAQAKARPWTIDARRGVRVRLKLGLQDVRQARRQLAEIDIAYAFDRYQNGRLAEVPALVLSALRENPDYFFNRGVWAILFRSLRRAILLCL